MESRIEEVARCIADRLSSSHDGPIFSAKAWVSAGNDRGHLITPFYDPRDSPGFYYTLEPGCGVVGYNRAYSRITQCHALVHELAHAEIDRLATGLHIGLEPGWLNGNHYMRRYDDDPINPGHQVARQVELICLRSILYIGERNGMP